MPGTWALGRALNHVILFTSGLIVCLDYSLLLDTPCPNNTQMRVTDELLISYCQFSAFFLISPNNTVDMKLKYMNSEGSDSGFP